MTPEEVPPVKTPLHEIRIGLILARIWRKRARSGARHTVSVARLYRNGDSWKESSRFGPDDLPVLRLVLDRAHAWIYRQTPSSCHHRQGP